MEVRTSGIRSVAAMSPLEIAAQAGKILGVVRITKRFSQEGIGLYLQVKWEVDRPSAIISDLEDGKGILNGPTIRRTHLSDYMAALALNPEQRRLFFSYAQTANKDFSIPNSTVQPYEAQFEDEPRNVPSNLRAVDKLLVDICHQNPKVYDELMAEIAQTYLFRQK